MKDLESRAFDKAIGAFDQGLAKPGMYASLNDAPCLPVGKVEVWYMLPDFFPQGIRGARPNLQNIHWTHALLGSIRHPESPMSSELLDDLWVALQGENWSPRGEANNLIRSKGLQHTSMSVGDCFRLVTGSVWMINAVGIEKLGSEEFDSRTITKLK